MNRLIKTLLIKALQFVYNKDRFILHLGTVKFSSEKDAEKSIEIFHLSSCSESEADNLSVGALKTNIISQSDKKQKA